MNSKSTDKRRPQTEKKENSSEHCPYAKKCGGCDYQGISYKKAAGKKAKLYAKTDGTIWKSKSNCRDG